jgi:hypothetical protein
MPDDDRLPRSLPRKWRAVAGALERGDDLGTLSYLTEKAIASTIRDIGGVPAINEICDRAHQAACARCDALPIDGLQAGLSPKRDRLPQTELAWGRARVLVETHAEDLAADAAGARHKIAASIVRAIAHHFGFARFVPTLVDRAPWTANDLHERCAQVLCQPGIDKLAGSLLRRPDGQRVHAPRHVRPSTEILLEMSVEEL